MSNESLSAHDRVNVVPPGLVLSCGLPTVRRELQSVTYGTYVLVTDASTAKDLRHLRPSQWRADSVAFAYAFFSVSASSPISRNSAGCRSKIDSLTTPASGPQSTLVLVATHVNVSSVGRQGEMPIKRLHRR